MFVVYISIQSPNGTWHQALSHEALELLTENPSKNQCRSSDCRQKCDTEIHAFHAHVSCYIYFSINVCNQIVSRSYIALNNEIHFFNTAISVAQKMCLTFLQILVSVSPLFVLHSSLFLLLLLCFKATWRKERIDKSSATAFKSVISCFMIL